MAVGINPSRVIFVLLGNLNMLQDVFIIASIVIDIITIITFYKVRIFNIIGKLNYKGLYTFKL
jgi:hypothetical protein